MSERYVDGTGLVIYVHDEVDCRGTYCCIHNPSCHHMRDWPTLWRWDRHLMERTCQHGVGHPDPDHINNLPQGRRRVESTHGCDGCCIAKALTSAEQGVK